MYLSQAPMTVRGAGNWPVDDDAGCALARASPGEARRGEASARSMTIHVVQR